MNGIYHHEIENGYSATEAIPGCHRPLESPTDRRANGRFCRQTGTYSVCSKSLTRCIECDSAKTGQTFGIVTIVGGVEIVIRR
jgi:hypothetical protein